LFISTNNFKQLIIATTTIAFEQQLVSIVTFKQ